VPTVLKYGSLNLLETSETVQGLLCLELTLKVQLNDKAVDVLNTESDRLTVCCVESDELQFLNIFFANKYATLISVDQLQCVC